MQQVGELHGEYEFGGLAGPKSFKGVEVLEAQRIGVDVLGHSVYCVEGGAETFSPEHGGLLITFSCQNLGLTCAFCPQNS